MNILMVDLNTARLTTRPLADPLAGGRLLTAQLITELVDPHTDPLGPGNILALAAGPFAGHRVSTGGRLSVGGLSPLTHGIKEANAGGMAGDSLAALGYRALVFTGARPAGAWAIFCLDEAGGRFYDAAPFLGLGNEALVAALYAAYGPDYVVVGLGPAGEQQLGAAGLAVTDSNGEPFRLAARGGLGAVMGSKRLKALLIRRMPRPGRRSPAGTRATVPLASGSPSADNLALSVPVRAATAALHKHVATNPRVADLREYGTASTLMLAHSLGGLPTRNFSAGQFEAAEAIGGDSLHDLIEARGGEGTITEACMDGCVIQCSNVFPDARGKLSVAPLEYETLGLCGSNLGLRTLDEIANLNRACNDMGVDTIEVGAAIGVLMEAAEAETLPPGFDRASLPRFGDGARAAQLVAEIAQGTPLGRLVGSGVVAAGQAVGAKRVPAVKGQAMSAYDPRAIKGTGVTYATSPQGADHTAGLTVFAPVDHRDASKAVGLSRGAQVARAILDALGLCAFNLAATGPRPDLLLGLLRQMYGVELPDDWLNTLGRRVIDLERAYNRSAGFTPADDRLPDFFVTEALSPTGAVFDVPASELDHMWDNA